NATVSVSYNGGETWAGTSLGGDFSGARLNAVVYGGGDFYIVGNGGRRAYSNTPANGSSWARYVSNSRNINTYPNEKDDPGYPFFGNNLTKVTYGTYGGSPGIAVVFDEWGGRRIALAAHTNFSSKTWDADLDAGAFGTNAIRGIAFGGGNFVAAGQSSMIGFWPSANPGDTANRYWRALPFHEFQYWEITALAALNGRFFAGHIGGKIGYSR
ncbi:MAG: hypothetical protein LBQ35_03870, partial [Spirochaetaceae bacterium]|nr:hypothetical protein [Spirochaetaceae bacterium]